jgi:hypothetical protein
MSVHYDRGFIGQCKSKGLRPVTLAVGMELVFQGGVSVADQMRVNSLMQELAQKYPAMEDATDAKSEPKTTSLPLNGPAEVPRVPHPPEDAPANKPLPAPSVPNEVPQEKVRKK